jgi:hypothetical protein
VQQWGFGSDPKEAFTALVPRPDSVNKANGQPLSPRSIVAQGKDAHKKALGQCQMT